MLTFASALDKTRQKEHFFHLVFTCSCYAWFSAICRTWTFKAPCPVTFVPCSLLIVDSVCSSCSCLQRGLSDLINLPKQVTWQSYKFFLMYKLLVRAAPLRMRWPRIQQQVHTRQFNNLNIISWYCAHPHISASASSFVETPTASFQKPTNQRKKKSNKTTTTKILCSFLLLCRKTRCEIHHVLEIGH